MKRGIRVALCLAVLLGLVFGGAAAQADSVIAPTMYWCRNRCADFMDMFAIGAGITTESKIGGPIPPALGVYVEATTLLNLGAISFSGGMAEWEGRGAGIYTEDRVLCGIGPYRAWKINQGEQIPNFYKNSRACMKWAQRMETDLRSSALARINRWIAGTEIGSWFDVTEVGGDPAKRTVHRDRTFHRAFLGVPRGWQTWEYVGAEAAICEPFLTHLGVTVRAGFDLSEAMDFVLGLIMIDFKKDDRRPGE